jgi:transcriptional regulator with XRE-family HTH domain
MLDLAHTYIQKLENGRSSPGAEVVVKLARLFEVTTDQLLLDELDLPPEAGRDGEGT